MFTISEDKETLASKGDKMIYFYISILIAFMAGVYVGLRLARFIIEQ